MVSKPGLVILARELEKLGKNYQRYKRISWFRCGYARLQKPPKLFGI